MIRKGPSEYFEFRGVAVRGCGTLDTFVFKTTIRVLIFLRVLRNNASCCDDKPGK